MTFEVWAPRARRVSLVAGGEVHPMTSAGGGWWSSTAPWSAGLDYGYLLDDDSAALPDPRSRRQPDGVHGLSRTFDVGHHEWLDDQWTGVQLEGSIIYELHIGTFTPDGTLDSAIERLDHLVDLGVSLVEVLPVNAFNGTHNWGYDGVLWFAVHEQYGGPAAYQRFVDACHSRGLGVVQDVVYNHLGPSGNYLPRFGPYLTDTRNTWGDSINLDGEGSIDVRDYIIDNALMWLRDYHVDALRIDAVHALLDQGEVHVLRELSDRVDALAVALDRPLSLIAESDLNDPSLITPAPAGLGLTAQWNDDYHHAAHVAVTGETSGYYADFDSLAALAKVMTGGFFHDGTYSSFRGRNHGTPIDPRVISTWQLVTFIQDHDQVGNRAAGDRISSGLDAGGVDLAAALCMLSPFTPMLFMGEEWAASTPWQFFTSHPEPELGRATAEGRIAEFEAMGWDPDAVPDPQDPQTFARSTLNWDESLAPEHARVLDLYRSLARVRTDLPGLTDPSFDSIACEFNERQRWLRLDRPGVSVVFNFAPDSRSVAVAGAAGIHFSTADAALDGDDLTLAPRSACVVTRRITGNL